MTQYVNLLSKLLFLIFICFVPFATYGMHRPNPQKPQPQPRQNPAAPKPAAAPETDEALQRALALSLELAQSPMQDVQDQQQSFSFEAMVEDIPVLLAYVETCSQNLDKALAHYCQNNPAETHQNIFDLTGNAHLVLDLLRGAIKQFREAADAGLQDICAELHHEMCGLKDRLMTMSDVMRQQIQLSLPITEQPVVSDFPVPASLQRPGVITIRHVRTGGQVGATCGPHAVVNARAIQQAVENREALTTATILAKAAELRSFIQGQNISDFQVYNLAEQIGLNKVLIFGFNGGQQSFYEAGHRWLSNNADYTGLQEIFTIVTTSLAGDYYFILNTGGHWVAAAIIKLVGQPPQVLYLDSGNGALAEGSLGTQFIKYLFNNIFDRAA